MSGIKNDDQSFGHIFALRIREEFPDQFDRFFKFSIVRNPFDRLHSWYWNRRYIRKSVKEPFKEWLFDEDRHPVWYESERRNRYCAPVAQQTYMLEWLTDEKGQIIVDHIVRFEDLIPGLKIVGEKIGEELHKLSREGKNNSENRPDYRTVYDKEMVDFVEDIHKRDLEHFGYSFE